MAGEIAEIYNYDPQDVSPSSPTQILGGLHNTKIIINKMVVSMQKILQETNYYLVKLSRPFPTKMKYLRAVMHSKQNFLIKAFLAQMEQFLLIMFNINQQGVEDAVKESLKPVELANIIKQNNDLAKLFKIKNLDQVMGNIILKILQINARHL